MHINLEEEDRLYLGTLKKFLRVLALIVTLFMSFLSYNVLSGHPAYFQDWRGISCIFLTLVLVFLFDLVTVFGFRLRRWPPSFPLALLYWILAYLCVFLLSCINPGYSGAFYIAFGLTLGLFGETLLIPAGIITALSIFAFQGAIWPLNSENLLWLFSMALPIASMIGFQYLIQNLLNERYKRTTLMKQLAQANAELEEAHQQLAQSIEQQQELAVLRERTRLAREMHDTIGHALVLISVKLEAAQRLRERDPARCEREIEETKEITRGTMTALRASIANLRSPTLEREHIYHALKRSIGELAQRTGIHVSYTLPAEDEPVPETVSEALWKVSQEAFTNIEKHAHARNVALELSKQADQCAMSIHDDGVGLPEECLQRDPVQNGHYGLRGIRERVEALGGRFTLHSARDQGTTIEILLPITADVKEENEKEKERVKYHKG